MTLPLRGSMTNEAGGRDYPSPSSFVMEPRRGEVMPAQPASSPQLVGLGLGLGEIQVTAVDGAAADDAFDAFVLDGAELLDVLHPGEPAGGNDGNGEGLRQFHGGIDVDAGEHAVAADVGVHD